MPQHEITPQPVSTTEAMPEMHTSVTLTSHIERSLWMGPLPPPDVLRGYEEICPGIANRIMVSFENEGVHRRDLEKDDQNNQTTALKASIKQRTVGQIMAFSLAVFALSTAGFLSYHGHVLVPSIIGGTTLIGIVASFLGAHNVVQKLINSRNTTPRDNHDINDA